MTTSFRAWLVDLDGTLYHPLPVRTAMAFELAVSGARVVPVIRAFRRQHELVRDAARVRRENPRLEPTSPYELQLDRTAEVLGRDVPSVRRAVEEWMLERPGKWLRMFRRRSLLREIEHFRARGGTTALVSDYPAFGKLKALGASHLFDIVLANGESPDVTALKPDPACLLAAAAKLGVRPEECLVIGDRLDADGAAAHAAKMAFRRIG